VNEAAVIGWAIGALGALIVAVAWLLLDKINGIHKEMMRTRDRLHLIENSVASIVTLEKAKKVLGRD
jgi:hypothetical protein